MSIAAGTRFGRYEIRSQIGESGMGEVYLAQDTQTADQLCYERCLAARPGRAMASNCFSRVPQLQLM